MQQDMLIPAIAVGVVLLLVLVVLTLRRRRVRRDLRNRFGPEYDRTVEARGSKRKAVRDLKQRQQLRSQLELRPLNSADRRLVAQHMAALQYQFVEDPAGTMRAVAGLATEVLRAQGYPADQDRERALRLFSVDHPDHAVALRRAIEGEHHTRVDRMRETFLGVRRALAETADIHYGILDAVEEHQALSAEAAETTALLPFNETTQRLPSSG